MAINPTSHTPASKAGRDDKAPSYKDTMKAAEAKLKKEGGNGKVDGLLNKGEVAKV
jgi:hypothetical protein